MGDSIPYRSAADVEHGRRDDGDEDEEEDVDETGFKAVKDAVLFAIDVSSSMLELPPPSDSKKTDRDSATSAALKCAYKLMRQRIISSPKDMMGILLFGTEQSKFLDDDANSNGTLSYPHCYLVADLNVPEAADIKQLRNLVEDESEAKKLLVPSTEPVAMSNVLFCANQIFTTKAANFSSRRLFLVTDNDNPHAGSKDLRSSATVRAKDLYDLGVTIELFPIARPGQDFDRSKFYDDIVYRIDSLETDAPLPIAPASNTVSTADGLNLLQSLLSSISSKSVPKRPLFTNIPLELSPDLKISVKGYLIYKRQEKKKSSYVWMDGETPQIATGSTTRMAEDTTRTVEKGELRKAFKFGGESVTFTPEELSAIRYFGDPVIRVIGFKDMGLLAIWANLKHSTFIYPSEEEYIGSTRTFSALQQTLMRKNKFGLVWYIARRNAAPVLAALIPGPEELNEKGEQTMPGGMWLVPLPFADDIRSPPDERPRISSPDDLTDKMRQVIQQLQLPRAVYDPTRYSNPSLQWHYRILQAMALDDDIPDQPEDQTIPKFKQIDKRTGAYVLEWGEILDRCMRTSQAERSGRDKDPVKKRSGSTLAAPADSKRKKTPTSASDAGGITDEEMKTRYKNRQLNKLTVAALKAWLKSKGITVSAGVNKADLVDEVDSHFENKMAEA